MERPRLRIAAGADGAAAITLHHDAWGRLVLTDADGKQHADVVPVRAFPISDPRRHVSLCDAQGKEVLWINDLDELPEPIRKLLEDDLARREFLPVIRRIVKVSALAEPADWEVETDRGTTRFVLKSEDDVRGLDDRGAMIVDAHGVRYLIPNILALDAHSRGVLERYL